MLPIWEIHAPVVETLTAGNRFVLVAPTGSGKTTQVPQMLLDAGVAADKKIAVLQPRRVAARTVAARVARERRCPLGGEVGYQIRFDDQTSLGTRISYVTEGILLRWLQTDPMLADIGVVLFDEFHERNLLSDVALALVKRLQDTSRPDLKLAVMSATLDADPVADYLSQSPSRSETPILISEGTSYPVTVHYLPEPDERPAAEQAADVVERIVDSGAEGDILVFMPGMGEINSTIGALRSHRAREPLALIPLHGDLPPEDQDVAFAPNSRRKVVVATNVAETSVTIDGIRHVVDSGLARVARYDAERGINTLLLEPISRASAAQRQGRAGRTAPGDCYRLWTESGQLNRPERNTPEIQRSDLAEVVLLLHSLGIRRAAEFDWLDRPDPQAVERAEALLQTLGALSTSAPQPSEARAPARAGSDLTPIGRQMLRLPMHPRYSRMLLEAARFDCVPPAALCAALVSGRDLLMRLSRDDQHVREARELFEASQESDFYTLLRAWHFAKKNDFNLERCRRYGIHAQTARQVDQTYEQLLQLARQQGLLRERPDQTGASGAGEPVAKATAPAGTIDPLPRCLMTGFIDQLCRRRDQGSLECDLTEGRQGTLMRESVVQNANLFVAASIREVAGRGSGNLTLLGLATAVRREWIEEVFPAQVTTRIEHLFDRTHKRVAAVKLVRFRDLVVHHEHQREADPTAAGQCLAEAHLKGWFELPLLNHEIKQFIARVNLVAAALPEMDLPPLDAAALAGCLARAFTGLTLAKDAQATNLRDTFLAHLGQERREWLDELAPLSLPWPDGRKLKLLYPAEPRDEAGQPASPELQVKLQECFPLRTHPQVCENRVPVKLWLCAPDGKRLEATFDWPAFRALTYPKLRAGLRKKYPGVPWL